MVAQEDVLPQHVRNYAGLDCYPLTYKPEEHVFPVYFADTEKREVRPEHLEGYVPNADSAPPGMQTKCNQVTVLS